MKNLSRKRQQQIIARYNSLWGRRFIKGDTSICTSIYDAYAKPSQAKINAWNDIIGDSIQKDGLTPIILGHNCMTFSACFAYASADGKMHYRYYTAYYTYDFTEQGGEKMEHIGLIEKKLELYSHYNMRYDEHIGKWIDDNGTRVPDFIVKHLFLKFGASDAAFILAEMSITH